MILVRLEHAVHEPRGMITEISCSRSIASVLSMPETRSGQELDDIWFFFGNVVVVVDLVRPLHLVRPHIRLRACCLLCFLFSHSPSRVLQSWCWFCALFRVFRLCHLFWLHWFSLCLCYCFDRCWSCAPLCIVFAFLRPLTHVQTYEAIIR